jgi:hypothetical protein
MMLKSHPVTCDNRYRFSRGDFGLSDRLGGVLGRTVRSLKETLGALEAHIEEETKAAGLEGRGRLCPCYGEEVARARQAIAEAEALAKVSSVASQCKGGMVGQEDRLTWAEVAEWLRDRAGVYGPIMRDGERALLAAAEAADTKKEGANEKNEADDS